MPYSDYPTDQQIQDFVTGSGVVIPSGMSWAGYGGLSKSLWENATGRVPFLADTVDVARSFDPPGAKSKSENQFWLGGERKIEFDNGLVSVTSVALGVTADNPAGQAMDLQRQVRMMPANAPARNRPWEWIEFNFPVYGAPSSVVITGKWGYAAQIPDDAWRACLRLVAAQIASDILQGIYSSPTSQKEGNEEQTQDSFRDLGVAWRLEGERIAQNYKLIRFGF